MFSYIIRRLLLVFPTLLGISAVVFFVMAYSPGGVGGELLNQAGAMKAQEAKALRDYYNKRYGLDKPRPVQYLRWLNQVSPLGFKPNEDQTLGGFGFKKPDLGYSFSKGRPVMELFYDAVPVTILLNAITIPIIYSISILTGILSARKRGGAFDVSVGSFFLALWSIPTIWAGVMLIGYLANRQYIQLFPTAGLHDTLADQMPFLPAFTQDGFARGWLMDVAWHLALPVICLTYGGFAYLSKLTRGSVLDNLNADYARTARAKGLDERAVLFQHVFRNSLLPLITVTVHILPALLAGALIIETIFSIDGMGKLMIEAVRTRDRELILANTLIAGLLVLFSNLMADILYAVADPRVSYE